MLGGEVIINRWATYHHKFSIIVELLDKKVDNDVDNEIN